MSITQEQFDALKPGDRVIVLAGNARVIAKDYDGVWVCVDTHPTYATLSGASEIDAIIPPAPQAVAWVNLDADATLDMAETRHLADKYANPDRTHVITIYDDGTTTTEAVS
jgi:hypothetical protein